MRFVLFALFLFFCFPVHAEEKKEPEFRLSVADVSLTQFSQLVFRDVFRQSYVLSPAIGADQRLVTFDVSLPEKDLRKAVLAHYASLGFNVKNKGGVYFIEPIPEFASPQAPRSLFVYEPRFRDASYLIKSLSGLFTGRFASQAAAASPAPVPSDSSYPHSSTSARALQDNGADVLVYYGTGEEIARLKEALSKIDVYQPDVLLQAFVYEVQTSKKEGSALSFALKLLGSKLKVDYSAPLAAFTGGITLSTSALDAVVAALNSDTRFKVLSSPSVRVRSGSSATFTSGAQVPILTGTTQTGETVSQSVEYRDSGVIFTVAPAFRDALIALDVKQELSNFVATTTGVNTSPTLNRRALQSSLSLKAGETVILGGLTLDQSTRNTEGFSFLPSFADANSSDESRTEILLLLSVSVADASAGGAAPRGAAPAE
jgi:type II secretory pathway component GspD/PulD (secretin)